MIIRTANLLCTFLFLFRKKLFLFSSFYFCCLIISAQNKSTDLYNVIWTSQSKNSSESMPCGGGDIGLNVWVEKGDILFYIAKSGSFDENNALLKLGRIRLRISSNPFAGKDFKLELKLTDGSIQVNGGGVMVHLWVDVFSSVIHADVKSSKAIEITASYENWRYIDHDVKGTELRENSYKSTQKFAVTTYRDEINFVDNTVLFFHRNRSDILDIFDYTVLMEGMEQVKSQMYNPIKNNTFGGILRGAKMQQVQLNSIEKYAGIPYKSWSIKTIKPIKEQRIEIGLNVANSNTIEEWKNDLNSILNESLSKRTKALERTIEWWKSFWDRSYIHISGEDRNISKNYQLFRYQLGCNAFGKWPTKFNGGLFTFDPEYVDSKYPYSPDFRAWGGGTMTAQNQRLVYWPMLKSGDFDLMKPQFDFYLNNQKNAELRSKTYWNHAGACFTEQLENFGLPNISEYNIKRPVNFDKGVEYNPWLEYSWETVFEFCMMMLEKERYNGSDIEVYLPFIESCLIFFDEHYTQIARQQTSKIGRSNDPYIFYPGSAAETYKMAYNSTTIITAMKVILERLIQLPDSILKKEIRDKYMIMISKLPPIPTREIAGKKTLAPAEAWARIQNTEAPQLYPVFPWGIYGVGQPNLETAINTWNLDSQVTKTKSYVGWRQHNIFAARLGLTIEAQDLTRKKLANSNHRFPTFWGPGFDWTPDHNWGGSAMIGLQEMLMQTVENKIYLFAAWPKEWDVAFKLHAPYKTIVEGKMEKGKLIQLKVIPETRLKDVVNMLEIIE